METGTCRYRQRIRLPAALYAVPGAVCSITVATKDRLAVLADPVLAEKTTELIRGHARRRAVPVHAFCVMPDHVHLVLEPGPSCDVIRFVGELKNLCQRLAWERGFGGRIWQTSFWDHFLRADEELRVVVAYVLNNPVRKGLVSEWREHRYSGSLTMDM